MNTTISWHGVHSSGATHYERGSSEDSHLLTLDYSETGPVEIAVTFSSAVCNKTSSLTYTLTKKCVMPVQPTTKIAKPLLKQLPLHLQVQVNYYIIVINF